MIFDKICNIENYKGINKNLDIAIDTIVKKGHMDGVMGKNIVCKENVFFNVQKYVTKNKEECFFETHEQYLDIQMVRLGEEKIGVSEIENLKIEKLYDGEKDVEIQMGEAQVTFEMTQNNFLILFPGEPHMPGISKDGNKEIEKVVYKVKIK